MNKRRTIWLFIIALLGVSLMITSTPVKPHDRPVIPSASQIVTDVDGNVYLTVRIGRQVWMVENLRTTRLNDFTAIPLVTNNQEWTKLTSPGYCWYNNKPGTYKNDYGALYNYYAVSTGKLAPQGWHVPTEKDWQILIDSLGGESVAGGKMKERGTLHWQIPNTVVKDSSGFSGLPGGCRFPSGKSFLLERQGYWWTAWVNENNNFAVARSMVSYNTSIHKFYESKSYGFSVRCIKD